MYSAFKSVYTEECGRRAPKIVMIVRSCVVCFVVIWYASDNMGLCIDGLVCGATTSDIVLALDRLFYIMDTLYLVSIKNNNLRGCSPVKSSLPIN